MKRIAVLAVAVGGVSDILLTTMLSLPILIYAYASGGILDLPTAQQQPALLATLHSNVALYGTSFLVGAFCSVLAGYLTGLLAKHDEVLNGALSSFLCIGFDLYAFSHGQFGGPSWLAIALLPVSPLLGAVGGYLRQMQRRSQPPLTAQ
ncbi:MAG: hypothetical protein WCC84_04705 [Candidatus Cybelea sp.]